MSWLRPLDQQAQASDACSGQGQYSEEMHYIPAGDESIGFSRLLLAEIPFVAVEALEAVCIKAASQSTLPGSVDVTFAHLPLVFSIRPTVRTICPRLRTEAIASRLADERGSRLSA